MLSYGLYTSVGIPRIVIGLHIAILLNGVAICYRRVTRTRSAERVHVNIVTIGVYRHGTAAAGGSIVMIA